MIASRPNVSQLAKLPLRAITAYASRAARRVLNRHRVGYAEACENALRLVNEFVRLPSVPVDAARRAAHAAAAVAEAEALDESGRNLRVGLAVRSAVMCCYNSIIIVSIADANATACLENVLNEADRAARQMDDADNESALADYEALVNICGNQESIELGEAFDPSESGPLGPIPFN